MNERLLDNLLNWYTTNFEQKLVGRWIHYNHIRPLLSFSKSSKLVSKSIGESENNIPIHKITYGKGPKKILIWSQMHGNESTGTKALFDLFNFFDSDVESVKSIIDTIYNNCTIEFIPMLNPDGALLFTRENYNGIDLNRDAVDLKAKESKLLREVLTDFQPQFCFNLHDQRSIFNVSGTSNPATLSFLAPSEDEERTLTEGRKQTMSVISEINRALQTILPNQIGRYTDEFYPTATGDNFQKLGHNTILIEAGHYKDDYEREQVRKYNFLALILGIYTIATTDSFTDYKSYFDIPNNDHLFLDIIYKDCSIVVNSEKNIADVGVQVKFKVVDHKLVRYEHVEKIGNLSNYITYTYKNAENFKNSDIKLSNS